MLISLFGPLAIATVVGLAKRSAMHLHHSWLSALAGRYARPSSLGFHLTSILQQSFSRCRGILEESSRFVLSQLRRFPGSWLTLVLGRLRPDFLARCKWDKELKACAG